MTLSFACVAAAVTTGALLVALTDGSGNLQGDLHPKAAMSTVGDDELTDLKRVSEAKGIALDEVVAAYAWQDDFAALAMKVEEAYPEQYAGARIEDSQRRQATVRFKGVAPSGAIEMLDGFSMATVTVIDQLPFSVAELDQQSEVAHKTVTSLADVVAAAVSSYDALTGRLRMEIRPETAQALDESTIRRALTPLLPPGLLERMDLVIDKRVGGTDDEAAGGWADRTRG